MTTTRRKVDALAVAIENAGRDPFTRRRLPAPQVRTALAELDVYAAAITDVLARLDAAYKAALAALIEHETGAPPPWAATGSPAPEVDPDPDDPEPAYDVLWSELTGGLGYRCAC